MTVQEAAQCSKCEMGCPNCPNNAMANDGYGSGKEVKCPFIQGAEWQKNNQWHDLRKQPDDLPQEDKEVILKAECYIFNAKYSNGKWWQIDGFPVDEYEGEVLYSSYRGINKEWELIAWMEIPEFKEK